jgi:ABC-type transporter lipoprotein component MlaA/pimeloyl-ACP methyl ester carboxylesterase
MPLRCFPTDKNEMTLPTITPANVPHYHQSFMNLRTKLQFLAFLTCLILKSALAEPSTPTATTAPPGFAEDSIVLPPRFRDPIEPFNRAIWGFNKGFMTSVVRPFSKGYRYVVVKPVRTGLGNMGKNAVYPRRFVNDLFQGKWAAMNDETERVFVNSIFGLGGFFDVATKWGVPQNDPNFGQTFKKWGWKPGVYIMLPIFGPSDERDAAGLVGDAVANPMFYFFPSDLVSPCITANDLTDTAEKASCFIKAEPDSYSILKYAWSFGHENRKVDMRVIGEQDQASLETLQSVLFSYTNAEFPAWGRTRSVLIPTTGKKLEFTFWLQPGHAPVVYIVPGFGGHRFSGNEMGLAELLYKNGFSAVTISSTFHPEFMERASTTDLPSYPPTDVSDVHLALTEIDNRLEAAYPHRLGSRALMGYSMGAFQSLFLAAQAATNVGPLVKFERYVAIDSPVNLRFGVTNLDSFYQGPLAWPAAERTANIENTFLKVVALSEQPPKPGTALPFNAIESRFLIALGLRLTLRDIIFSSQLHHNQGVLKSPLKKSRRHDAYEEILQYSFWDYINKFAIPYDKTRGIDMTDPDVAKKATSLRPYTAELQANTTIRVIANRNDFLLEPGDVEWIESTFAPARVTLFDHGGHLGNFSEPAVQRAILGALDGLGAVQDNSKKELSRKFNDVPATTRLE